MKPLPQLLREIEAAIPWAEDAQPRIDAALRNLASDGGLEALAQAVRDAQYVPALLNLRCPGNNGCDDPVQCQSYEASEQSAPCPAGCCVMAEEKDVRSIIAAIDEENAP